MGMASQTSTQPEIISGPQSQHYSFYGNANKPAPQCDYITNTAILSSFPSAIIRLPSGSGTADGHSCLSYSFIPCLSIPVCRMRKALLMVYATACVWLKQLTHNQENDEEAAIIFHCQIIMVCTRYNYPSHLLCNKDASQIEPISP